MAKLHHHLLLKLVIDDRYGKRRRFVGQEASIVRALQVKLQIWGKDKSSTNLLNVFGIQHHILCWNEQSGFQSRFSALWSECSRIKHVLYVHPFLNSQTVCTSAIQDYSIKQSGSLSHQKQNVPVQNKQHLFILPPQTGTIVFFFPIHDIYYLHHIVYVVHYKINLFRTMYWNSTGVLIPNTRIN